jgi:hypothetical protein
MLMNHLLRHPRYGVAIPPREDHDLRSIDDEEDQVEVSRRPPRTQGSALGRTVGVTSAAFFVGYAQGHFGTSKVNGVPAELIAAGLLHTTAACAPGVPAPARRAMRALGDGALAAAALVSGVQARVGALSD